MPTTAKLLQPSQRSMELLEDDFEDANKDFEEIRKFLADLKVNCENMKNAHYDNW